MDPRSTDQADASRAPEPCERPADRQHAIFIGWNDAAWGRPRRCLSGALAHWYNVGYTGGQAFRLAKRADGQ